MGSNNGFGGGFERMLDHSRETSSPIATLS
jgi:hypothetical protein